MIESRRTGMQQAKTTVKVSEIVRMTHFYRVACYECSKLRKKLLIVGILSRNAI